MKRRSFITVLAVLSVPALAVAQLRSPASSEPAWITIRNLTNVQVELLWIDFEGRHQSYGLIAPGGTMEQSTYAGHIWVVRDAGTRRDFGTAVARGGRQLVEVAAGGVTIR